MATTPTPSHPEFTFHFLAVRRSDLNDRPHRESVNAPDETTARRMLARDFVLLFAGRVPSQGCAMRDCLRESMKAAMSSMPDEESRWSLRVDADWHRVNLLAGIAFVGKALEESQLRENPITYSRDEICQLAGFLQTAPALIGCMAELMECYDQQAGEVSHA